MFPIKGTTTSYLYDGADIIKEVMGGVVTSYIRTLGIDDPLSKITGSTVQHYLKDGLGSTIGLVDDNGNTISSIAYDAYGNSPSSESFGYTGRENDGTGLLYYRARYYSPEMRRFMSRDPLGFAAHGVNFYEYVGGDPVNSSDPSGSMAKKGILVPIRNSFKNSVTPSGMRDAITDKLSDITNIPTNATGILTYDYTHPTDAGFPQGQDEYIYLSYRSAVFFCQCASRKIQLAIDLFLTININVFTMGSYGT